MYDLVFNIFPLLASIRSQVGDRDLAQTLRKCADLLDVVAKQAAHLTADEKALAAHDKIGAIKMVRERLGIPLKDAKDMVDEFTGRKTVL